MAQFDYCDDKASCKMLGAMRRARFAIKALMLKTSGLRLQEKRGGEGGAQKIHILI
jgi:hypothetical protein